MNGARAGGVEGATALKNPEGNIPAGVFNHTPKFSYLPDSAATSERHDVTVVVFPGLGAPSLQNY